MSDPRDLDPLTAGFWAHAAEHRLVIQRCGSCRAWQFYPRPFCLACDSEDVGWVEPSGEGTVYAATTVHLRVRDELPPPYTVALVELDEGPRLLTHLTDDDLGIGDRVELTWWDRPEGPPLPLFGPPGAR